ENYPSKLAPAMVFPFDPERKYCRVKPDHPRKIKGKPAKYESPRGRGNRIYIPPAAKPAIDDAKIELMITEGEKKASCATQHGFPCIGLTGVFNWKASKSERLLPALEEIAWQGRRVFIVFDSD